MMSPSHANKPQIVASVNGALRTTRVLAAYLPLEEARRESDWFRFCRRSCSCALGVRLRLLRRFLLRPGAGGDGVYGGANGPPAHEAGLG